LLKGEHEHFRRHPDDERVRATMRGIRRSLGTARAKKTPATVERIVAMAPLAGGGLANIRDRALLLFGFASAMRRSELAALNFEDIEGTTDGLRVNIRRSKTDQEGHGDVIAIPLGAIACPVAALKAWLEAAVITEGPVFRPIAKGQRISDARLTDRSIANIVKAHAARVGLDAAAFAGHSLRHVGSKSGVLHYWRHAAPYVFALRVRIQNDALYHELEELVRWLRDERMPVYSS
jgi:integrase